jgi:hypothetical protein
MFNSIVFNLVSNQLISLASREFYVEIGNGMVFGRDESCFQSINFPSE